MCDGAAMRSLLLTLAAAAVLSSATAATAAPRLVVERSGGVAGVQDRLVLGVRGVATVTHRTGAPVRLAPQRTRALRRALRASGFETLAPVYKPIGTVADGFVYALRHRGRTVRVEDAAEGVPARLQALVTAAGALLSAG